jgi:hypothetical protein
MADIYIYIDKKGKETKVFAMSKPEAVTKIVKCLHIGRGIADKNTVSSKNYYAYKQGDIKIMTPEDIEQERQLGYSECEEEINRTGSSKNFNFYTQFVMDHEHEMEIDTL